MAAPAHRSPSSESSDPDDRDKENTRLHWQPSWARVGLREYITVPTLTAGVLSLHWGVEQSRDTRWSRPILFDSTIRRHLVAGDRSSRETAATISDGLLWGSMAHVVFDNVMVYALRNNPDVAWQMAVINAQAYAMSSLINLSSKRLFRRARPYVEPCQTDAQYSKGCGQRDGTAAFFSGHAALTATSAGLICAHHTHLQLYGNPLADAAACALAVGMTAATGVLRMTSDNHWATDVVVGHLMGYAVGYLLPTLLYYKDVRPVPGEKSRRAPIRAALVPGLEGGGVQLNLIGFM